MPYFKAMGKQIGPLNEQGKPTDLWFIYKVPLAASNQSAQTVSGYEYLYFDMDKGELVHPDHKLDDAQSALHRTLSGLFDQPADTTGWIIYNDEIPSDLHKKDQGMYGHTKGVLAFDTASKTAFWLLHSWPKFVNPKDRSMPVPDYGQTYLCISLDLDTADKIAGQMIDHQQPQVFQAHIPASLDKGSKLYGLSQEVDANATGDSNIVHGFTRGGVHFCAIAKNRKWGKDFWTELVAVHLKDKMDVESWIRGPIAPEKVKDGFLVEDIKYIDFSQIGFDYSWSEKKDHAKWGLTLDYNWICVGDINRMLSQEKRGGGAIAFQHPHLWKQLKAVDFIKVPKGKTLEETKAAIKTSHGK